jgi:hypothetical protein
MKRRRRKPYPLIERMESKQAMAADYAALLKTPIDQLSEAELRQRRAIEAQMRVPHRLLVRERLKERE